MKVIQTISGIGGKPVEVVLYTGDNLAEAIVAAGQGAVSYQDAAFVSLISVRIDF